MGADQVPSTICDLWDKSYINVPLNSWDGIFLTIPPTPGKFFSNFAGA